VPGSSGKPVGRRTSVAIAAVLVLLLSLFAAAALAAAGQLDNSFSGDGKRLQPWGASFDDDAESVSIQADGRIVAAGFSNQSGPAGPDMAITRYMPNGSLDHSFSGDGKRLAAINIDVPY
jgi:hypothetical protein